MRQSVHIGSSMLSGSGSATISKKSEEYLDLHYYNITKLSLNTLRSIYNVTHRQTSSNNRQVSKPTLEMLESVIRFIV